LDTEKKSWLEIVHGVISTHCLFLRKELTFLARNNGRKWAPSPTSGVEMRRKQKGPELLGAALHCPPSRS